MRNLYTFLKYGFICIWSMFVVAPFLWALSTSFKDFQSVTGGATYIPWLQFEPTLEGWRVLWRTPASGGVDIVEPYFNSIIVTCSASLISILLGTLAAYALSRFTFKAGFIKNNDITFFFISQRIMPPVVLSIPFFIMLGYLGLLDSLIGLIMVYIVLLMPIAVWIMVDFFNKVPREIDETALIDGCNPYQAFFKVVLPNSIPGMIVAGMFCLIFGWTDFFFAFILTFTEVQLHLGKGEDESEEEVGPSEDQAEHAGNNHAGDGVRQHHLEERLIRVAPIDQRRLVDFTRHLVEEIHHDPDGNRHQQHDVDHDQANKRVEEPEIAKHDEERDRQHHRRHNALRDKEEGDVVILDEAGLEGKTRQGIGRQRTKQDADQAGRTGHDDTVKVGLDDIDPATRRSSPEHAPAFQCRLELQPRDVGGAAGHRLKILEGRRQRPEERRHNKHRPDADEAVFEECVKISHGQSFLIMTRTNTLAMMVRLTIMMTR